MRAPFTSGCSLTIFSDGCDSEAPGSTLQLDPKEIAKARAKVAKAEAKAAQVAKETRGMKKMSAFFKKPAAKAAA